MTTKRTGTLRRDAGLSLTEMIIVVALLSVVMGVVFTIVQVLSTSAGTTTTNGTASMDLSNTMGEISKAIMDSKVLYADDYRIVVLNSFVSGAYELDTFYVTAGVGSEDGTLVWEHWACDASATAPVANSHKIWVMSTANSNLVSGTSVPLFSYYKDATQTSLMSAASGDKATGSTTSVAAFVGTMPGGYTVSAIRRVRLRLAARFSPGVRDDYRDILLRVRN